MSGVLILGRGSDGKITAGVGDLPGGRMRFPANEGFITLQVKPGTG